MKKDYSHKIQTTGLVGCYSPRYLMIFSFASLFWGISNSVNVQAVSVDNTIKSVEVYSSDARASVSQKGKQQLVVMGSAGNTQSITMLLSKREVESENTIILYSDNGTLVSSLPVILNNLS